MPNPPACQSALEKELAILREEHRLFWNYLEATSRNIGMKSVASPDEKFSDADGSLHAVKCNPRVVFDVERPYFLSAFTPVANELASIGVDTVCAVEEIGGIPESREFTTAHHLRVPIVCRKQVISNDDRRVVLVGNPHRTVLYPDFSRRILFSHGGCPAGNLKENPWLGGIIGFGITHYFALGPGDRALGDSLYPGVWESCEYIPIGWPKLDIPVESQSKKRSGITELGLDPNLPTILLCSHWSSCGLFRSLGPSVMASLWDLDECNILVTAHPSITHIPNLPFKFPFEFLFSGLPPRPNFRYLSNCDSARFLHLPDLVISDLSSISVEAACLGAPVVMFRHPDHSFSDEKLEAKLASATYPFENVDELLHLVRTILNGEGTDKRAEVEALSQYAYYNFGSATKSAAKAIAALL